MVASIRALCLAAFMLGIGERTAQADAWDRVVPHLAVGARIALRTDQHLRIAAPGVEAMLNLTTKQGPGTDIWQETRRRRGRNAYQVWYVGRHLLSSKTLPKHLWPRFLNVEFLRVLRVGPSRPRPGSEERRLKTRWYRRARDQDVAIRAQRGSSPVRESRWHIMC